MSFTTRCPACGTMFKVVPDQLKISDGWVRCGHCADVFDARLYLEPWTPPQTDSQVESPPVPEAVVESPTSVEQVEQDASSGVPADEPASPAPEEPSAQMPWGVSNADSVEPVVSEPEQFHSNTWQPIDTTYAQPPTAEPPQDSQSWSSPSPSPSPSEQLPAVDGPTGTEPFHSDQQTDDQGKREVLGDVAREPEPSNDPVEASAFTDASDEDAWEVDSGFPEQTDAQDVQPAEQRMDAQDSFSRNLQAEPADPASSDAEESDFEEELKRFAAGPIREGDAAPDLDAAQAVPEPESKDVGGDAESESSATADTVELSPDEPGFVLQARRRAFWQSPGMRVFMSLLALLLAGLLAGQWALHERDRLAGQHPAWAPVLSRLCEPLGCRLGPVRRIDAVVIESSSLVRRLGNFYSFDLVLKNTSDLALAVPALELTLTDTRDEVISRRIFLPEEFPGSPTALPVQGNLPVSFRLSIALSDASPMAGYRALVFYP